MARDGTIREQAQLLPGGTSWSVVAADDLDGDGKPDLLWRDASGAYAAWLMNGTAAKAYGSLLGAGTGWELMQVADLDGDHRADLIWRSADGTVGEWLMNGLQVRSYGTLLVGDAPRCETNACAGWSVTP